MFFNSFKLFNSSQFNPLDPKLWIIFIVFLIIGFLIAVFGF
ncbi:hypothetical protein ES708_15674 [subsurface metagenome]